MTMVRQGGPYLWVARRWRIEPVVVCVKFCKKPEWAAVSFHVDSTWLHAVAKSILAIYDFEGIA
jgi:hypothetical protein